MSEQKKLYELYRDYSKHEDDLINHRSNWTYLIQSFLVATYGFTIQKKLEVFERLQNSPKSSWQPDLVETIDQVDRFLRIISFAGVCVGIAGLISIVAAIWSIRKLELQWIDFARSQPPEYIQALPGLTGGGAAITRRLGTIAGLVFPFVLVAMWVFLAGLSLEIGVSLRGTRIF